MTRLTDGDTILEIELRVGHLPLWQVGRRNVLHNAPWRDEPRVQALETLSMCEKRLAGDFFCMPFSRPDGVTADPQHGYTANSRWDVVETSQTHAKLALCRRVRGARVTKDIRIAGPVLYQTHTIDGGAGDVTMAHHPMVHMKAGGRLSFSPKRAALTDPVAQYQGHNLWILNQLRDHLHLECEDGSMWDLRDYPAEHQIEDFAMLAEARGRDVGWTVLMRHAEDDMVVALKDARVLPMTMLWVSNGGRDFEPWNNRHTGVLGIEDGCTAGARGFHAALRDTRLASIEVPSTVSLGGRIVVRHAMISLPRPAGWSDVTDIALANGQATLTEIGGDTVSVPFEDGFLA